MKLRQALARDWPAMVVLCAAISLVTYKPEAPWMGPVGFVVGVVGWCIAYKLRT